MSKSNILILCTGNSCRSQMAEGILRAAAGDLVSVHSAGSNPAAAVHPLAIEVMEEIGIDISARRPKHMDIFEAANLHTIITVCDHANQACLTSSDQVTRYHWEFLDPAEAEGSEDEILAVFRNVRDQIRLVFEAFAAGMKGVGWETPASPGA